MPPGPQIPWPRGRGEPRSYPRAHRATRPPPRSSRSPLPQPAERPRSRSPVPGRSGRGRAFIADHRAANHGLLPKWSRPFPPQQTRERPRRRPVPPHHGGGSDGADSRRIRLRRGLALLQPASRRYYRKCRPRQNGVRQKTTSGLRARPWSSVPDVKLRFQRGAGLRAELTANGTTRAAAPPPPRSPPPPRPAPARARELRHQLSPGLSPLQPLVRFFGFPVNLLEVLLPQRLCICCSLCLKFWASGCVHRSCPHLQYSSHFSTEDCPGHPV